MRKPERSYINKQEMIKLILDNVGPDEYLHWSKENLAFQCGYAGGNGYSFRKFYDELESDGIITLIRMGRTSKLKVDTEKALAALSGGLQEEENLIQMAEKKEVPEVKEEAPAVDTDEAEANSILKVYKLYNVDYLTIKDVAAFLRIPKHNISNIKYKCKDKEFINKNSTDVPLDHYSASGMNRIAWLKLEPLFLEKYKYDVEVTQNLNTLYNWIKKNLVNVPEDSAPEIQKAQVMVEQPKAEPVLERVQEEIEEEIFEVQETSAEEIPVPQAVQPQVQEENKVPQLEAVEPEAVPALRIPSLKTIKPVNLDDIDMSDAEAVLNPLITAITNLANLPAAIEKERQRAEFWKRKYELLFAMLKGINEDISDKFNVL